MRRALLVMLLLVATGCGASKEDDARAVVKSYFIAVADRDAQAVCAVMSPVQRQSVDCEQGMRDVWADQEALTPEEERQFRAAKVTKVLMGDDRASVYMNVTEEEPFELILIGDEWFLDPSAMA